MLLGIIIFSIAVFAGSFLVSKNYASMERSELALYIVLIAWGSMIAGFYLSKHWAVIGGM